MNSPEHYIGGELDLFAQAVHWKAYQRDAVAPYVGGRVLEVGAGLGEVTAALGGLPRSSWLCLEPDRAMAAGLRERVDAGTLPPAEVRAGTLAALGPAERFDAILYIDVLEHIADDAGELSRAAAHLAPGGYLVVLSPAHQWLYSPFDRAVGHHRRYRRASLRAAAPAGLSLVRLVYLDSVGLLASLANRLLLRKSMPSPADIALWDRAMVPLSRRLDPLFGHRLGKSVLGVWQRVGA